MRLRQILPCLLRMAPNGWLSPTGRILNAHSIGRCGVCTPFPCSAVLPDRSGRYRRTASVYYFIFRISPGEEALLPGNATLSLIISQSGPFDKAFLLQFRHSSRYARCSAPAAPPAPALPLPKNLPGRFPSAPGRYRFLLLSARRPPYHGSSVIRRSWCAASRCLQCLPPPDHRASAIAFCRRDIPA